MNIGKLENKYVCVGEIEWKKKRATKAIFEGDKISKTCF